MDDIEEVIYSQGEPYLDELHENRSWDSDGNSTSDITCSGWINVTIKYPCWKKKREIRKEKEQQKI